MTFRFPRAARAALACALLTGTTLPILSIPTPAVAQHHEPTANEPTWTLRLLMNHLSGQTRWSSPYFTRPGEMRVLLDMPSAKWQGTLFTSSDKLSLEGEFSSLEGRGTKRAKVTPKPDGVGFTLTFFDADRRVAEVIEFADAATAPAYRDFSAMTEVAFPDWIGEWQVNGRSLRIRAERQLLTGTYETVTPGGRATTERIVFLRDPKNPRALTGSWQRGPMNASPFQGGSLAVELSADKKSFAGDFYESSTAIAWKGVRPGAETSPPQPAPQPQPLPSPPPASPPPPAPPVPPVPAGSVAATGVFHPLETFDARVDDIRAGRDGRLHVFVTAKNRSGRDFYMSAVPFTVHAIDSDGVGVEAEGKPYRATGEEAAGFDQVPTIAAGSEFRFRYLLDLPEVHGPLARVSVREGKRKSLLFDASGADPAPSNEGAPAAGRGSFKRLSKFDVRIDNVVTARDGRMEVFLTLRNATSEVQSTSKGALQLSSSNADGSKVTSVSALYSVRGERGRYDELPLLVYAQPGAEMRLRYLFDEAISGPITISDGTVAQTFTAGT